MEVFAPELSDAMTSDHDHALTGFAANARAEKSPYFTRLHARQAVADIKRQIVFGMAVGWLLALFSWFRFNYVPNVNDGLWFTLMWVGVALVSVSIVAPTLLTWPERAWMAGGQIIGKTIFLTLLTGLYFVMVTPIGALMRKWKGTDPFYSWGSGTATATDMEGWIPKEMPADIQDAEVSGKKRSILVEPIRIFSYFIRQGHYLVLPLLVIIIALGLLMFFVQSSALAPFIYTLF